MSRRPDRRDFLKGLGLGAGALGLSELVRGSRGLLGSKVRAAGRKPNVVVIMSDDMGFSDFGCYGGEIETPVVDALAANGLRFTHFYNTARCCPTRACLMSGLYPHQAGVGHMMGNGRVDGYRGDLNKRCVTIPEVMKTAGYSTYMAGKWHVTPHTRPEGPKHNWPLQRGYDRFYGTIHGAGSFFDPNTLTRDNTMISPYADPEYKPETFYYTDAISDHIVRFVREHDKARPFFAYVAYTAAHWPMHALPKDIAKYKGRYDAGYAPFRKARFERAREMGLIEKHWKLSAQAGDWNRVQNKRWEAAGMEVYAAMVDNMDAGIGRIAAVFQDNGGCAESMWRGGNQKRADKPTLKPMDPKALQRGMIPRQTRDGWPVLKGTGVLPGPADTYIPYGKAWANVSNTPFREYKHWVHEGGIATPLVVHWPAGIKARGELRHHPSHLIDIMATCVDVSGATYPKRFKDNDIQPMEGVSLVPAFEGRPIEREALYWEHEANCAVRVGDWKLVRKRGRPWELYDMKADRTETNDLAGQHPDRVKKMGDMWDRYAVRTKVVPRPGRGRKKKPPKKK
jgi:arylsulfatase